MMLVVAAAVGLLTGLHAASWGAFKDAPFEGFHVGSYLRSIVVAAAVASAVAVWLVPGTGAGVVVLVGTVYAVERVATEWWKSILREDDQRAYTIPMRLGFRGRPVDHKGFRYTVGAAVMITVVAGVWGLGAIQRWSPDLPSWLVIFAFGGAGGWATAFGGAWKDAPIEGFSGWKFLRSPAVATAWALPLSLLTDSWVALLLASAGFAVASIETYKTFLTGGRPPGKFAGRPIRVRMPVLGRVLAGQHAILWMAIAAAFVASLATPLPGLSVKGVAVVATQLPSTMLTAVALAATGLGMLVIHTSSRLLTPEGQR